MKKKMLGWLTLSHLLAVIVGAVILGGAFAIAQSSPTRSTYAVHCFVQSGKTVEKRLGDCRQPQYAVSDLNPTQNLLRQRMATRVGKACTLVKRNINAVWKPPFEQLKWEYDLLASTLKHGDWYARTPNWTFALVRRCPSVWAVVSVSFSQPEQVPEDDTEDTGSGSKGEA